MPTVIEQFGALLVYGPLLVLLHELGHVLFSRWGGTRVVHFSIGLGRPMIRLGTVRGAGVTIGLWAFAGGACVAIPVAQPDRSRAWYHAGGLLVNAAVAVILWILPDTWWLASAATFNGLVALTNAVPWRFRGSASDGWHLLDMLRGARSETEIVPQRDHLSRFLRQAELAGAPLGVAYARLGLAWCDVVAGRISAVAPLFEDRPDFDGEPWLEATAAYVEAEWHRQCDRPLAALGGVRAARVALADDLGEDGIALLALAEAGSLVDLGEPQAARRALAMVVGARGPVARQALVLLLACALDEDVPALEFATWRVVRRATDAWLDPVAAAVVLWSAAARLDQGGRQAPAVGVRDAARALGRRTLVQAPAILRPALRHRLGSVAFAQLAARTLP